MSDFAIPGDEFWRVLLDYGALNENLVGEFKKMIRECPRKPLGQILVRKGFLSVKQMATLISLQAEEPESFLGDLAVREGYCTEEQVNAALSIQAEVSPGSVGLLAADDRVMNDKLLAAVASYLHHLEGRVQILREALNEKTAAAE